MIEITIRLHPWVNDGAVVVTKDGKVVHEEPFATGVMSAKMGKDKDARIAFIRKSNPGLIEAAEEKARQCQK